MDFENHPAKTGGFIKNKRRQHYEQQESRIFKSTASEHAPVYFRGKGEAGHGVLPYSVRRITGFQEGTPFGVPAGEYDHLYQSGVYFRGRPWGEVPLSSGISGVGGKLDPGGYRYL